VMSSELSHLDSEGHVAMVDVSTKSITQRTATAEARIRFPSDAWEALERVRFATKKGSVEEVARIAGMLATKKTADLIPLCHALPLEGCEFTFEREPGEPVLRIACTTRTSAKTGVEMEALTGVTVAALTVYDMTKSLGHGIVIEQVRLLHKAGGKQEFRADEG